MSMRKYSTPAGVTMPVQSCLTCPSHTSNYQAKKADTAGKLWHQKLISVTCKLRGGLPCAMTGIDKGCPLPLWEVN